MTRARFRRAAFIPISKRAFKLISYNRTNPHFKEMDMADKKTNGLLVPPKGGMIHDLVARLKLILRLMGDGRVNIFLKALPLASLAYLFFPADLAPGIVFPVVGALDDAAILGLGAYLFVELCPPAVVQEHMNQLAAESGSSSSTDIVDAETTDVTDDKS